MCWLPKKVSNNFIFACCFITVFHFVIYTSKIVLCKNSVERLFYQLMKSGHPALDPLFVSPEGVLSIRDEQLESPQVLCTLLHGHRYVEIYKLAG